MAQDCLCRSEESSKHLIDSNFTWEPTTNILTFLLNELFFLVTGFPVILDYLSCPSNVYWTRPVLNPGVGTTDTRTIWAPKIQSSEQGTHKSGILLTQPSLLVDRKSTPKFQRLYPFNTSPLHCLSSSPQSWSSTLLLASSHPFFILLSEGALLRLPPPCLKSFHNFLTLFSWPSIHPNCPSMSSVSQPNWSPYCSVHSIHGVSQNNHIMVIL